MHPLACMKSRVFNVIQIPSKYDTPHGREQLAASITCLRHFVADLLDLGRPPRVALEIYGQVFRYCAHSRDAKRAYAKGFDPFDAVAVHPALPVNFERRCLPTWRRYLDKRRARYNPH